MWWVNELISRFLISAVGESRLGVGGLYMRSAWVIQQSKRAEISCTPRSDVNDDYVSLWKGLMNHLSKNLPVLGKTTLCTQIYAQVHDSGDGLSNDHLC